MAVSISKILNSTELSLKQFSEEAIKALEEAKSMVEEATPKEPTLFDE